MQEETRSLIEENTSSKQKKQKHHHDFGDDDSGRKCMLFEIWRVRRDYRSEERKKCHFVLLCITRSSIHQKIRDERIKLEEKEKEER